jgi:hypothetical protein
MTHKKLQTILHVNDEVFSNTGETMKVLSVNKDGITTDKGFYSFDEHRQTWFLTKVGREHNKKKNCDKCFHAVVCRRDVSGQCPHFIDVNDITIVKRGE